MKFAIGDRVVTDLNDVNRIHLIGVVVDIAFDHPWPYRVIYDNGGQGLHPEAELTLEKDSTTQSNTARTLIDQFSALAESAWDQYGEADEPSDFKGRYNLGKARAYDDCLRILREARL
jgi:hypothetical protein